MVDVKGKRKRPTDGVEGPFGVPMGVRTHRKKKRRTPAAARETTCSLHAGRMGVLGRGKAKHTQEKAKKKPC